MTPNQRLHFCFLELLWGCRACSGKRREAGSYQLSERVQSARAAEGDQRVPGQGGEAQLWSHSTTDLYLSVFWTLLLFFTGEEGPWAFVEKSGKAFIRRGASFPGKLDVERFDFEPFSSGKYVSGHRKIAFLVLTRWYVVKLLLLNYYTVFQCIMQDIAIVVVRTFVQL